MADPFRGRIIYVPGKNPKPDPLLHRALLWRALHAGLTAAQPACAAALDGECFTLAAWNRVYYRGEPPVSPDFEAIERLLAGDYDPVVDAAEAESWRVWWERTARGVIDRFPFLLRVIADPAVREVIAETQRYFNQQERVGREVREVLKALLRPVLADRIPVLVIGHSLGSVIAYDSLWELTHHEGLGERIEFVSIGSPLGLKFVQARLLGADRHGVDRYPHLIARWHNIAAIGDMISLDPELADNFGEMRELGLVDEIADHFEGIHTHYRDDVDGLNPHRSYGYLVHPVTSARIAEWWGRHR